MRCFWKRHVVIWWDWEQGWGEGGRGLYELPKWILQHSILAHELSNCIFATAHFSHYRELAPTTNHTSDMSSWIHHPWIHNITETIGWRLRFIKPIALALKQRRSSYGAICFSTTTASHLHMFFIWQTERLLSVYSICNDSLCLPPQIFAQMLRFCEIRLQQQRYTAVFWQGHIVYSIYITTCLCRAPWQICAGN